MVLIASLVQKTCYDNLPMLKIKDPENSGPFYYY
jgi:hypothetical protein